MATKKIEGISTGLGYVGTVPKAEEDGQGNNIYNSYARLNDSLKLYAGEKLTAGVYLVRAIVGSTQMTAIVRYKGGETAGAFLGVGVSLSASGAQLTYEFAQIDSDGILKIMSAKSGTTSSVYEENTDSKPYYVAVA